MITWRLDEAHLDKRDVSVVVRPGLIGAETVRRVVADPDAVLDEALTKIHKREPVTEADLRRQAGANIFCLMNTLKGLGLKLDSETELDGQEDLIKGCIEKLAGHRLQDLSLDPREIPRLIELAPAIPAYLLRTGLYAADPYRVSTLSSNLSTIISRFRREQAEALNIQWGVNGEDLGAHRDANQEALTALFKYTKMGPVQTTKLILSRLTGGLDHLHLPKTRQKQFPIIFNYILPMITKPLDERSPVLAEKFAPNLVDNADGIVVSLVEAYKRDRYNIDQVYNVLLTLRSVFEFYNQVPATSPPVKFPDTVESLSPSNVIDLDDAAQVDSNVDTIALWRNFIDPNEPRALLLEAITNGTKLSPELLMRSFEPNPLAEQLQSRMEVLDNLVSGNNHYMDAALAPDAANLIDTAISHDRYSPAQIQIIAKQLRNACQAIDLK